MPYRTLTAVAVIIAAVAGTAVAIHNQHSQVSPIVAEIAPFPHDVMPGPAPEQIEAEHQLVAGKLEAQPDSPGLLAQMAMLELEEGLYDVAVELAERALAIDPAHTGAKLVLAKIAEAIHLFDRAIVLAAQVAAADRDPTGAHVVLCTAYVATGRPHDAVPLADGIVQRLPVAGAFLQRALVYEAVGRNAEAELDYIEALRRESATDVVHATRARTLYGRFCMRQRRWADAEALLSVAVTLRDAHGAARALLGETLAMRGQHDRAATEFALAFEAGGEPSTLVAWARCTPSDEKRAELLEQAEQALEHGHNHHHHDHHGHAHAHGDDHEHGHGHGASALAHATGHVNRDMADLLLTRLVDGDAERARDRMLEELNTRRDWRTLLLLSRAQLACGDANAAYATMREALATGIRVPSVYEVAAQIEVALERADRAAIYRDLASASATAPSLS